MAKVFLSKLPTVPAESLPAGSECPICSDEYSTEPRENEAIDSPVRLPCDHIVGSECIKLWLLSNNSGANTCPLCRHQFFAPTRDEQGYIDIRVTDTGLTEINITGVDFVFGDVDETDIDETDIRDFSIEDAILLPETQAELRRIMLEYQATIALRESARDLETAQQTRPTRERALYLQLQREGARLPPLPARIPGISASPLAVSMNESLGAQSTDRNEEAFFELLQRMGAFNEPIGMKRRLTDDRRLVNRVQWYSYRSDGLVYYPSNVIVNGDRGGGWYMG